MNCTLPAEDQGYNALCEAVFRMGDISETMNEAGAEICTMRSASILKSRAFIWTAPDPDDFGTILLDDCVVIHPTKKTGYSVFLFETCLLCCTEGKDRYGENWPAAAYPIQPWDIGPALRKRSPLDIAHVIPTSQLESVLSPDTSVY